MGYNKTTIIVDKESVKPILIWKFSGMDSYIWRLDIW